MEHHAEFHTERWSQAVVITTQGYLGSHRSYPSGGSIALLGPVSGAHFNPVVSLAAWWSGRRGGEGLTLRDVAAYLPAQTIGGAVLADAMFAQPLVRWSTHDRFAGHLWLAEVVATAGLVALIFGLWFGGFSAIVDGGPPPRGIMTGLSPSGPQRPTNLKVSEPRCVSLRQAMYGGTLGNLLGPKNERQQGFRHWLSHGWWQGIGAIGGVVGVIVAVLALTFTQGGGDSTPSPVAGGRASGSPPEATSQPSQSYSTPPVSPTTPRETDAVRWSGRILLTQVDLDTVPPRVLPANDGASLWVNYDSSGNGVDATLYGLGGGSFTTLPSIAPWNSRAKPTRQQCQQAISTQGVETLPASTGNRYCAKTGAGRIVFVAIEKYNRVSASYMATVIIWENTS
jgi:glycerol uptake facilitator-like aquaporin